MYVCMSFLFQFSVNCEQAIHIRERYTAFRENKDASLTEIHDFVKKMPKLTKDYKSLNEHINIAALVKVLYPFQNPLIYALFSTFESEK